MTYSELNAILEASVDEKYRQFHAKLVPTNAKILGIRTPDLKNIAKKISKENIFEIIDYPDSSYDITTIKGLAIGYYKGDFAQTVELIEKFLPKIDNWATCDLFVANLKFIGKNKDKFFSIIKKYLSGSEFMIRFSLVSLMTYYICDEYIETVLNISSEIKDDRYYVRMANAWLIQKCFVLYRDKTIELIKSGAYDDFTQNKAISKICDSYRVKLEDKIFVKTLRR